LKFIEIIDNFVEICWNYW